MRILSQKGLRDGIIDVPYEQVSIEQKENEIWCGYSSTMDRHCVGKCFAKYSTEVKARKAMEMLREEYTGMPSIRRMDDLYGRFKHTGKKDFELFIEHMVLKKCYFQFPTDDEVEV